MGDCLKMTVSTSVKEFYEVGAEKRFYHNYEHASYVARLCDAMSIDLLESGKDQNTLYLAAIWHDAVYVPGATDNEEKSAEALLSMDESYTEAAELIRRTTIKDHLSSEVTFENNPLLAILLDADLASLATESYDKFVENQEKILMENGFSKDDFSISAMFLKQFLIKRSIYRTVYGKEHFEERARRNIQRFVDEYFPIVL